VRAEKAEDKERDRVRRAGEAEVLKAKNAAEKEEERRRKAEGRGLHSSTFQLNLSPF
jgi:hypothetical protein